MLSHDTKAALVAAVALVNSAAEPDTLATDTDLDVFVGDHGYTNSSRRTAATLAEVRAVRGSLRTLLTCGRDEAAALVNAILADKMAVPRLVRHDTVDWHLHIVPDDSALAVQIEVETAMAVADLIRGDEMSRLGTCADPECDGLVADLSRNRSRRFCSTACGNRAAVAAYRARKAVASDAGASSITPGDEAMIN